MEQNKKNDRFNIIKNIIIAVFIVILTKIIYMTTYKYEHYKDSAENKAIKRVSIPAPRGEIYDKDGELLATNINSFVVQVSGDEIDTKNSEGESMANDIALDLINLLESNEEEYIDEFPIYIKNGKFYFTYDENISEFKDNPGYATEEDFTIPQELDAKESFYYIVDKMIEDGLLEPEDRRLEPLDLQAKVNEKGVYPPILVSKWIFTEEKNKSDWLAGYGIKDTNISAENAFKKVKDYEKYEIDQSLSDEEARKILIVRDAIKSQGYSKYEPVTIARDIDEDTISLIKEKAMSLPGVTVSNEPTRYYPNGNLASHVLGHMGKIPSAKEEKYLEDGYNKNDMIGMTGIEGTQESVLKGEDGYQTVQVDALGQTTDVLDKEDPKAGGDVYLTIDKDLQEIAESSLKRTIEITKNGGTFESPYGNKTFSGGAQNAESGAVMAIDVKTGEVLAMASYPDFDPNLFATGISSKDYNDLMPDNPNDLLSPSHLSNINTQSAFQPGSTFKMIVGMAAIDNGLSPNYSINDPGVIEYGDRTFGDAIWNKYGGNHGYTNLYKAIQESCNVYFYTLGSGKNWSGGASPSVDIGTEGIFEYSKLFGLNEGTGLGDEIVEYPGKVPTDEMKLENTQNALRADIHKGMENDFKDITEEENPEEYDARIEEIVSWTVYEDIPTRGEIISRLTELNVKEDKVEEWADTILHSYIKFAEWMVPDEFNLSIGQGENAYTPSQIARYTAAIANGGDLVELSVLDKTISNDYQDVKIYENKVEKIPFNDPENLQHLVEGMKRVVTDGTAESVFGDFPISVAAKTGTAQKEGKIPTDNEVEYLTKYMGSYGVSLEEAEKVAAELKEDREAELTEEREEEIKEKLEDKALEEDERAELEKELEEGVDVKIESNDKNDSIFLRRAIKEINPSIDDKAIDRYKQDYGDFAWDVAFAPADDPEIAVVSVIPQGNDSTYALLPIREIMGEYFGLNENLEENSEIPENQEEQEVILPKEEDINFGPQIKK